MFKSRRPRVAVLLATPALAAVSLSLAACGSSSPQAASDASTAKAAAGVVTPGAASGGTFTASQLRSALLTKINGATPATPASDGNYSSLPGMKTAKPAGVSVNPQACASESLAGFDTDDMASSPAATTTFKVGGNGVSEVLIAPSSATVASALAQTLPAECAHYTATVSGKTYQYSVKGSSVSGIGQEARVVNVQTAGYPADNIWVVMYRGADFVGAVTVVGPEASETAVRELGSQAYGYAAKALS